MKITMPVKFNGTNVATSVRVPPTLPEKIDAILSYIEQKKGVHISRNSLINKAIYHYLEYIGDVKDFNEGFEKIIKTPEG